VIGFPHGSSTLDVKHFEARRAVEEGGKEIDMVVNIGRVKSGKWEFVRHEIETVNKLVVEMDAILKVIFENDCTLIRHPIPFRSGFCFLGCFIFFLFALLNLILLVGERT
jgi:deoxyribose-phosphate aldolase